MGRDVIKKLLLEKRFGLTGDPPLLKFSAYNTVHFYFFFVKTLHAILKY